jgi:hypothetical protein
MAYAGERSERGASVVLGWVAPPFVVISSFWGDEFAPADDSIIEKTASFFRGFLVKNEIRE